MHCDLSRDLWRIARQVCEAWRGIIKHQIMRANTGGKMRANLIANDDIWLYRNDGLAVLRNVSSLDTERIKKKSYVFSRIIT